jgi:hypothetical protein
MHQEERNSGQKNLRIRAGRCKIISTKSVLKKLTNQYLWDPDCLVFPPPAPAIKRKGMSLSATSYYFFREL